MPLKGRRSIDIDNFQTLIKSPSLVKFSHFLKLVNVNKLTDKLCLKSSYIFIILDFTGFASTKNIEFEKIFSNALFS